MIALLLGCTSSFLTTSFLTVSAPTVVKPARRDPAWAKARCNDGTPFAYSIRPGTDPIWIVHLTGGFFCEDDRQLCSERERRLVTTLRPPDGGPARMRGDGVLSVDPAVNPTFARATVVDAHYCSSDLWLGDSTELRPTTGAPEGWYFSGRENFRVLLEALRKLHGLDDADPAVQILVLGSSAGGAGVVGNLDALVAAFPHAAADQRLKVVLDGSWVPEQPPGTALPDAAKWGPVHPECDRDHLARGEPPRDCVYGPAWWPYVEKTGVPVLVQLSALDRTQTPVFGVDTPEEQAAWRARTRASLAPLPWVFSAGTPYHVLMTDPLFDKGPPGKSLQELVDHFWLGGPPEQTWVRYPNPDTEGAPTVPAVQPDDAAVNGTTPGR